MKKSISSFLVVLFLCCLNSAYSQISSGYLSNHSDFNDISFGLVNNEQSIVADWSYCNKTVAFASVVVYGETTNDGAVNLAYMDTDLLPGYMFVDTSVPSYNPGDYDTVTYEWYIEFSDGTYSGYYATFSPGTEVPINEVY